MPATFEEALKTTLVSINEDFEKADADLHKEVVVAAQSLANITQGAATMSLKKRYEAESGIHYDLFVSGKEKEYSIAGFFVSSRGYPIKILSPGHSGIVSEDGTEVKPPSKGTVLALCKDRDGLTDYFSQLASNPDSTLVTAAAYIMRKK